MKIAEYKQMMAYLTRPKFNNGGSVGSFVKPKKKPKEEAEKVNKARKEKNFEKVKGALENPKEVKEMIDKPKRGLVDEPGSYGGEDAADYRKYLDKLKPGSIINRQDILEKFDISPSTVTKIVEDEYANKKFSFEELKRTSKIKFTEAQQNLSQFLFGKPAEELSPRQSNKLRFGKYNKKTITNYRTKQINAEKYDKFALDNYDSTYDELDRVEQKRVRNKLPPADETLGPRLKQERANKRMIDFQNKFLKDNGRLPSETEYRRGGFEYQTIKRGLKEKIIKALSTEEARFLGATKKLNEELLNLSKNKSVQNIFKKGNPTKTDLNVMKRVLKTKDDAFAERRIYQLAAAYSNEDPVPGIRPKYIKNALNIMDQSPYRTILRAIAEKTIGESVGEPSLGAMKQKIRKNPQYIFSGDYNIDEPAGLRSSVRRGSTPYGIFGQVIRADINKGAKKVFDSQKSVKERLLQEAIASKEPEKIDRALTKFNNLVSDYEKKLNADVAPGEPKVRLFRATLDSPNVSIKNFNNLNPEYQKAFTENFKSQGYSFEVPKDINTLPEIVEKTKNPNTIKRMQSLAKKFAPRLLQVPLIGGGAYVAATRGPELARNLGLVDRDFEQTAAVGDAPVTEKPVSLGEKAIYGGAAMLPFKKSRDFLLRRILPGAFGPTGLIGMGLESGAYDLTNPMGRVTAGAEAAFAPSLVKGTVSATQGIKNKAARRLAQQALNFGLPAKLALRAARVLNPIGIAALGGEALYNYGKFVKSELDDIKAMTPEKREQYNVAEQEQMGIAAAGGGLLKQAGDRSGKPPEAGPTPQGLAFLKNNVKKL